MIDLTPLDVRKRKGDFRRAMRGYEPALVDDFLDLVAERLEELVRENASLRDRAAQLTESVAAFREREKAMNEALVSAQQLREEVRAQASKEADQVAREARAEADRIVADARREAAAAVDAARRIHFQRGRFLKAYRAFVERQLGEIEMEEERLREVARQEEAQASSHAPTPDPASSDVTTVAGDH